MDNRRPQLIACLTASLCLQGGCSWHSSSVVRGMAWDRHHHWFLGNFDLLRLEPFTLGPGTLRVARTLERPPPGLFSIQLLAPFPPDQLPQGLGQTSVRIRLRSKGDVLAGWSGTLGDLIPEEGPVGTDLRFPGAVTFERGQRYELELEFDAPAGLAPHTFTPALSGGTGGTL